MFMRPVTPQDIAHADAGNVQCCPHVTPETAKMVGCDDQGFGHINWHFSCDGPACIAAGNNAIAGVMIDWDHLQKGEIAPDSLAKKLMARM